MLYIGKCFTLLPSFFYDNDARYPVNKGWWPNDYTNKDSPGFSDIFWYKRVFNINKVPHLEAFPAPLRCLEYKTYQASPWLSSICLHSHLQSTWRGLCLVGICNSCDRHMAAECLKPPCLGSDPNLYHWIVVWTWISCWNSLSLSFFNYKTADWRIQETARLFFYY